MFIEWLRGLLGLGFITQEEYDEYSIQLLKSMYGNLDDVIKFFETYCKYIMKELKMVQSCAVPCVFFRWSNKDEVILIAVTHVDDTLLGGMKEEIEWLKKMLKLRFRYTNQPRQAEKASGYLV
jgi:hypothetical protein